MKNFKHKDQYLNNKLLDFNKMDKLTPTVRKRLTVLQKMYRSRMLFIDKLLGKPIKKEKNNV